MRAEEKTCAPQILSWHNILKTIVSLFGSRRKGLRDNTQGCQQDSIWKGMIIKHYKVGVSRGFKATHSTTTAILELESVWKWDFDRSLAKLRRKSEEEKRTRRSPPPYQWPSPGPIGQQSRGIISLRILKFMFSEKAKEKAEIILKLWKPVQAWPDNSMTWMFPLYLANL